MKYPAVEAARAKDFISLNRQESKYVSREQKLQTLGTLSPKLILNP